MNCQSCHSPTSVTVMKVLNNGLEMTDRGQRRVKITTCRSDGLGT